MKMKNIYSLFLILTALLCSGSMWGDQLNEGFEGTFAPEGWTTNHSGGTTYAWERVSGGSGGYGTYCAYVRYGSSGKTTVNYLITPQLRPQTGEKLVFYTKQQYNGNTTFTVEVSTATAATSDFTTTLFTYTDAGGTTSSWAKQEIDLASYVGQDIYLAFHVVDVYGFTVYLDDVSGVTLKPESCPKTGKPTASAVETTTATISWAPLGTETTWNLRYKKANAASWTEVNGLTSASYDLTGLSSGTTYNYEVQADCGGGDKSDWNAGVDFSTECATATLPFEPTITAGSKPNCWNIPDASWGDGYSGRWYTYLVSGSNCLRYYASSSSSETAVTTPSISITSPAKLRFDFQNYNGSRRVPSYVTISNSTVTKKIQLPTDAPNSMVADTIDLTDVDGVDFTNSTITIAFSAKKHTSSSGTGYCWIKNIKVFSTQDCSAPQNVELTASTNSTADFSWTANAGVDSYKYCVVAQGAEPDFTADLSTATNSVQVEDLTAGNYTFYVKCACGTAVSDAVNFEIVSCPAVTAVSLFNPLYNGVTVNWTSGASACDVRYKADEGDWNTDNTNIADDHLDITGLSVGTAYTFEVKPSCGGSWVGAGETYTPAYGVPAPSVADATDAQATASWAAVYGADSYEYVVMPGTDAAVWTNPGTTAALTATLTGLTGGTNYTVYVRSVYGENKSNAASAAFSTTTVSPTDLIKGEITANSATYSWSNPGAATQYQWKTSKAGSVWSDPISETTATATGLDSYTDYTFYVRSYYGSAEGQQSAAATDNFKTAFGTQELPYSEDFYYSSLPTGWDNSTKTCNYAWATSTTKKVGTSGRSMQFYAPGSGYADLVTPSFNLSENAYLLFQSHNENALTGKVYIKIGSIETEIFTIPESNAFVKDTVDLTAYTGEVAKFIFRGTANSTSQAIYVDNFEVKAKPCDAPTALAKVESSSSVVLSWTDDAASKWNLRWREVGASDWNEANNLTAKSLTLSTTDGLELEKTYQAQVQAVCTATKNSEWSSLISFGLVCGAAPTSLTVSARTTNSATLTWEGAESAFKLQTSLNGEDWEDAIDVNDHTYALTGLNAGTTYFVRVQNACGGAYAEASFKTWCDSKLSLPTEMTSFSAVPTCWEVSSAGAVSFENNKMNFTGVGEKFLYLPQTSINLNLLSITFTFTGTLEFGYIDEPNGAFTAFASQPTSGVELDLATEADAAKYIAVRYNGSSLSSASISAISIRKTPTCLKPTGVAGTPGVGSAEISWTAGGSETAWNLQYKTGSADWTEIAVSENPYNLSGLVQGVTYKVRVQANCGEELSDWSDEASFITNCEGVALPWDANFSVALSNCWTIYAQDETYYKPSANTFSKELQMTGGKNGASNNVVVLPAFATSLTDAMMTFEYRGSTGSSYAQLEAGYVTDKADATTFVVLETLAQAASYTEARIALNTVPAGAYLAFRYAGASSHGDQYIRNLRVANTAVLADNVNNTATLGTLNGQTLDVTIGRTITRTGYFNTLCLPFDLPTLAGTPLEGAELWAFKYAVVENNELLFRIVEASSIEAGKPYFIQFAEGDAIVNPLFKNVTIAASAGRNVGDATVAQLCGILKPETFTPGDKTKLFLYNENALYWWNGASESALNSFRAYFYVNTTSGANYAPRHGMPARIIKEEQTTTGCENIQLDTQTIKLIENNQVVIIRNGIKYTIQGQVISK